MTAPIPPDELDRLVEEWHEGDDPRPLHEFLGWTWEEYVRYMSPEPE